MQVSYIIIPSPQAHVCPFRSCFQHFVLISFKYQKNMSNFSLKQMYCMQQKDFGRENNYVLILHRVGSLFDRQMYL